MAFLSICYTNIIASEVPGLNIQYVKLCILVCQGEDVIEFGPVNDIFPVRAGCAIYNYKYDSWLGRAGHVREQSASCGYAPFSFQPGWEIVYKSKGVAPQNTGQYYIYFTNDIVALDSPLMYLGGLISSNEPKPQFQALRLENCLLNGEIKAGFIKLDIYYSYGDINPTVGFALGYNDTQPVLGDQSIPTSLRPILGSVCILSTLPAGAIVKSLPVIRSYTNVLGDYTLDNLGGKTPLTVDVSEITATTTSSEESITLTRTASNSMAYSANWNVRAKVGFGVEVGVTTKLFVDSTTKYNLNAEFETSGGGSVIRTDVQTSALGDTQKFTRTVTRTTSVKGTIVVPQGCVYKLKMLGKVTETNVSAKLQMTYRSFVKGDRLDTGNYNEVGNTEVRDESEISYLEMKYELAGISVYDSVCYNNTLEIGEQQTQSPTSSATIVRSSVPETGSQTPSIQPTNQPTVAPFNTASKTPTKTPRKRSLGGF